MRSIRKFLLNDWPRKLSALIFACLIYGAVRMQLQEEETIDQVRLEVRTEDRGILVLDEREIFVSVRVQGTKRNLDRIKNNNQIAAIHVIESGSKPGPYTCYMRPEDIDLPRGIKVVKKDGITPSRVHVVLDRLITKEVNVRLRINRDTLPSGLTIRGWHAKPNRVVIKGPEKYLADIDEVVTEPISFGKNPPMSDEFSWNLVKPPKAIQMIPATTSVSINLHRSTDYRQFNNIPIQVMHRTGSQLYVSKFVDKPEVSFLVEGDRSETSFIDDSHVRAYIEIDESYGAGRTMRPVRIWLDRRNRKSCVIKSKNPDSIRVVISKRSDPVPPKLEE